MLSKDTMPAHVQASRSAKKNREEKWSRPAPTVVGRVLGSLESRWIWPFGATSVFFGSRMLSALLA